MAMTDGELRDAAWKELTETTISYDAWRKRGYPSGHWRNAKNYLDQIGVTPPGPGPTGTTGPGPSGPVTSAYPNGSPYPAGTFWNGGSPDARQGTLDPNSSSVMATVVAGMGPNVLNLTSWTVATQTLSGGEKLYDVAIVKYPAGTTLRGVPIPAGTKPDPAGDGHLVILDLAGGFEYQMWQALYDSASDSWQCGAGAKLALGARAVPASTVGAYDANFPLMGGVVTPEEMQYAVANSTDLKHPLIYAINGNVRLDGSPVCPATTGHGSASSGIPNGAWLRLDPSLNVEGLSVPSWEKVMARTLQRFGAFNRDGSGSSTDWSGENTLNRDPALWSKLMNWNSNNVTFSSSFPWNRLQLLHPPC